MNRKKLLFLYLTLGPTLPLLADQFHYQNLIVGERAMGLGGAFCGVADDASALIYNPAGIAFSVSNDITGSANAFYKKKVTYKKAIGTYDFTENSGGSLAPFFGGMQKVDSLFKGLAVAFGLYTVDSELKDQNDLIRDVGGLERFHRTSNIRNATTGAGIAVAQRISSKLAIGLSLSYLMIDELVQEYQDVQYITGAYLVQNVRTRLSGNGLESGIGVQYALGTWSLGMNLRLRHLINDSYELNIDQTDKTNTDSTVAAVRTQNGIIFDSPLGNLAHELRFGVGWFPTARVLWTFDVIHHTAAESGNKNLNVLFDRMALTNFASGVEYYITPSMPLRLGVFSNLDSRPELVAGKTSQPDHIDYVGYSMFMGWVQPNSQVSGGFTLQTGEGEAQKIQGPNIQSVAAQSLTLVISATHNF